MSGEQRKMTQDEILEAAIHGGSFEGDEATVREVESLRVFLSACRETSRSAQPSGSLAERALAATTREDLSWRGDLRLVGGYLGDAIRSSAPLRLAAASLLIHVMVIPVVAYLAFTDGASTPQFSVDVTPRSLPYSEPLEGGLQEPSLADVSDPAELNTLLVENSLRWGRWQLERMQDPRLGSDVFTPAWLEARAEILWGDAMAALPPLNPERARLFIEAECILDRYLVGRYHFGQAEDAEALFDAIAEQIGDEGRPETWLALSTLSRAESYGLLGGASRDALQEARGSLPSAHRYRSLMEIDGDLRRRLPLDPLWVEALGELDPEAVPSAWEQRLRSMWSSRAR